MLNPRWDKVYDPKDIADFDKLMGTAPPIVYPFQHQILYRLLGKYYRTNKGNQLHPENPRHLGAFFDMVQRTMEELKKQVMLKDDFEERQRNEQWEQQREKDEDPIDRILREDEMKRNASDKILLPKKHIKEDLKEFNELQGKIEEMKNEDKEALKKSSLSSISFRKISSNVPNPLRQNYDYSSEMGGPEWQNRVKNFEKDQESAGGTTSCGIQRQKK